MCTVDASDGVSYERNEKHPALPLAGSLRSGNLTRSHAPDTCSDRLAGAAGAVGSPFPGGGRIVRARTSLPLGQTGFVRPEQVRVW